MFPSQAELERASQVAADKDTEAAALSAELRQLKKKLEDMQAERAAVVGANKKISGERELQVHRCGGPYMDSD